MVRIAVQKIIEHIDIFSVGFRIYGRLSTSENKIKKAVIDCVANNKVEPRYGTTNDIERIAHFVINEDNTPIDIDVGCPSLGLFGVQIQDGCHRLAAAVISGKTHINVSIAGELEYAYQIFGTRCEEIVFLGSSTSNKA